MKAQFSRDSYQENKTYSGVYQQQGRMLTDADWNEMVRILKTRMDKTVGASIPSGSPREGGILLENSLVDGAGKPIRPPFAGGRAVVEKLKWGRVYVDGMYGEILPTDESDADPNNLSIGDFLKHQRDLSGYPNLTLQQDKNYVVYIDLWERLVLALEDERLLDEALHKADTCVRTETVAQVKVAALEAGSTSEEWTPPSTKGNAVLTCTAYTTPSISAERTRNALLRLEVHEVTPQSGGKLVELKWSLENAAEQYEIGSVPPGFFDTEHVYEVFTADSERHVGVYAVGTPEVGTLCTGGEVPATAEDTFVRRWDGRITLDNRSGDWRPSDQNWRPLASVVTLHDTDPGMQLRIKDGQGRFELLLQLDEHEFIAGDYWLVLLRDSGSRIHATALSPTPFGIDHHYMVLGTLRHNSMLGEWQLWLTAAEWRRLSFPSLTKLTVDRVLIEDADGKELASLTDLFVDAAGDTMTGALKIADKSKTVGMTLSHSNPGGPRIDFAPPNAGGESAWIKATTEKVHSGRRTTLELGVGDDGLDDILLNATGDVLINAKYNVGIGTKAPHAKLDVKGPVRIDSRERGDQATAIVPKPQIDGVLKDRGFLEAPWVYTGQIQAPIVTETGVPDDTGARIRLGSDANGETTAVLALCSGQYAAVSVNREGNVGIGTNASDANLAVHESIAIGGSAPQIRLAPEGSDGDPVWIAAATTTTTCNNLRLGDRVVACSTDASEAQAGSSEVNCSEDSSTETSYSSSQDWIGASAFQQVNCSRDTISRGKYSQANCSRKAISSGMFSQVNCSSAVTSGARQSQINCSTDAEAITVDPSDPDAGIIAQWDYSTHMQVNCSESATAKGKYSQVNCSCGEESSGRPMAAGYCSQVNCSLGGVAGGIRSQVNCSETSTVSSGRYWTNGIGKFTSCAQINCSRGATVMADLAQINCSVDCLAEFAILSSEPWRTQRMQINCSERSIVSGAFSQVNCSYWSKATHYRTQTNACYYCEAANPGSIVLASWGVKSDQQFAICGGVAYSSQASPNNRTWEIRSAATYDESGQVTHNAGWGIFEGGATTGTLSDYGEYFPNLIPDRELGMGLLIALVEDKVRPAQQGEEVIGVVSGTAAIRLGDSPFCWQGRYKRDEWGRSIYKEIKDPAWQPRKRPQKDWKPTEGQTEADRPMIAEQTEEDRPTICVQEENPDYDPKREQKPRSERPKEWTLVGLLGQVYVRCDETIVAGECIESKDGGIGTRSKSKTNLRAMKKTKDYNGEYSIWYCLLR